MSYALPRRQFLANSTAAGVAAAAGLAQLTSNSTRAEESAGSADTHSKVVAFTKSFQDRPVPEVCRLFKRMGLDGLDLTVRPGGHIAPENVVTELPLAVEAARTHGVAIMQLTTAITDPDQNAERILATASKLGIKKIKMGYYRYTQFGKLARQMDEVRKRISAVAKLASKYGVLPCVHIHSGAFIPSHGTMLYQMLREFSPEEVGAYVDPLHMTIEGGKDGWRQGLDLLAPWIALCAMKNFDWQSGERDRKGQQRWHTRLVPVADGIAPIPEFVGALKKLGYKGHYSLHSEYKGRHSFKNMTTDECLRQTAVDLKFFRQLT